MQNIQINNGNMVTIGSTKDVIEAISEYMSYELARYIEDVLYDQTELEKLSGEIEDENIALREENEKLEENITESNPERRHLYDENYFEYLMCGIMNEQKVPRMYHG